MADFDKLDPETRSLRSSASFFKRGLPWKRHYTPLSVQR
jgi:hypothetical protein